MPEYIKQVAITGDISRIGTDDDLIRAWCSEVAKEIYEQKCEFAVVHVQGLHSAENPDYAARVICGCITDNPEIYRAFDSSFAFFDTKLTGLGNLYLFKNHSDVQYYNRFSSTGYINLRTGHQHSIGKCVKECDGFIQNTFGQSYTFRKDFYNDDGTRDLANQRTGFLLARFRIHGKEVTFVNLNLHSVPFEDVNEIATKNASLTKAAAKREDQIEMLLKELDDEGLRNDAILVAGSFNSQLHETDLLNYLAKTQLVQTVAKKDEDGNVESIEHVDRHGRRTTTVERTRFDLHSIHDWFFRLGRGQMVKRYNGELADPSRHYELNEKGKEEFQRTLCPAWSDRILYNDKMNDLFRHDSFCASGLYYGLVAEEKFVGPHKPVALHASICLK
ncbi:Protein CBG05397 [Caenorhabditis briggsae]|uniref:Protein CBG05397 n=1 Tax=Caenorhabditis briggsae TaxID=6238 RepID=A8WZS2_CAEBR|nr:Protein CBG05397 [Caenorhabditis briggsae]CAP25882.2 Protein CBG05397 [Caenorhabditis briggsae]